MNVKVIDFFPLSKQPHKGRTCGTMHVYLVDLELDICGVYVCFTNTSGASYIRMPSSVRIDPETGKNVRYPILAFTDQQKNKELTEAVQAKAHGYIKHNLIKEKDKSQNVEKEQSAELIKT
jgi:hypothetical protein